MTEFDAVVTVRHTRYASDETGFAVVEAANDEGARVVLVGPLIHLEERERAHVVGTWTDDHRYGRQVKVVQARPLTPTDVQTLTTYLCRVKHVGARRAASLIERYGTAGLFDAIDADPPEAFKSVGLTSRRAREAARSWAQLRVMRQLHLLLAPHGLGYLVTRIHRRYGTGAHRIVTERPYELTSVFGVGFAIADRIAGGGGAPANTPQRTRAGLLHLLAEAERAGSTCLPRDSLLTAGRELLQAAVSGSDVDALVVAGALVQETDRGVDQAWIYRPETAELEAELAEQVVDLVTSPTSARLRSPSSEATARHAGELTAEQLAAVTNAFAYRLSLITGGPGTGKTASIRAIGALAGAQGARLLLAAPTGRAAIRMTEASGITASTVHSALGWVPEQGPTHDQHDPLTCDLLIVDETSMANLELLVTLLRAVGPRTHVVLVGDADQLAPVGAGKPFAELVDSAAVPTARLTHIFRQAAGSMIVQAAHAIRRGDAPTFAAVPGMRRDLFMIEREDPGAALTEIVSLVTERLPTHYEVDPLRDIQVFAPVYRGALGIDALNQALRAQLNRDGQPVAGGRLRVGDKLMMTGRNLHELGLMNGTLLRLLDEISGSGEDDEAALILAAEETIFRLPPEEYDRLALAYACSVHRGQGIELPVAVIIAHPAAGAFFLRREMLYTAITRAKLATVIVGSRDVIARAARTPDTGARHSRLARRLPDNLIQ